MRYEVFNSQIGRLSSVFGERNYGSERIKLLWEIVRDCDDFEFEKQVSAWIVEQKFSPLGKEFQDFYNWQNKLKVELAHKKLAYELEHSRNEINNSTEKNKYFCHDCNGTGEVLAMNKESKAIFLFVCGCNAGKSSHWSCDKKLKSDFKSWQIGRWDISKNMYYSVIK